MSSSESSPVLSTLYLQNRTLRTGSHILSPLLPSFLASCVLLPAGKLWSRSIKLAYNILHKLGSKQEPMVRPGDRVSHAPPPPHAVSERPFSVRQHRPLLNKSRRVFIRILTVILVLSNGSFLCHNINDNSAHLITLADAISYFGEHHLHANRKQQPAS